MIKNCLAAFKPENKKGKKKKHQNNRTPRDNRVVQRESQVIASLLSFDQIFIGSQVCALHPQLVCLHSRNEKQCGPSIEQSRLIQTIVNQPNIFSILMGNAGEVQTFNDQNGYCSHQSCNLSLRMKRCLISCDKTEHPDKHRRILLKASQAKLGKTPYLKCIVVKLLDRCHSECPYANKKEKCKNTDMKKTQG